MPAEAEVFSESAFTELKRMPRSAKDFAKKRDADSNAALIGDM